MKNYEIFIPSKKIMLTRDVVTKYYYFYLKLPNLIQNSVVNRSLN